MAGILVSSLIGAGCLAAPGSSTAIYTGDAPDPAWTPIYYGVAEVYGTDTAIANVPTYAASIPGLATLGSVTDALPVRPSSSSGYIWAPTVRWVGGKYLMMFSESVSGRANCIGSATSPNGLTFTPNNAFLWCSPNPAVGYLDPDVFVDPSTGIPWMYYSQQWSPGGGSEIDVVQLAADGSGAVGQTYTMVTYDQVASYNTHEGAAPFIENPSVTSDRKSVV